MLQRLREIPIWVYGGVIIGITGILCFGSLRQLSLTVDEQAHIPAGYSYIVTGDYRLNPEHPPLLKVLSGLSIWGGSILTGTELVFNTNHPAWAEEVNGQWVMGDVFLFESGNPTDSIIYWARIPNVILFLIFIGYVGYAVYHHTRRKSIAILAMIFTGFSPNMIAHARLVTTDLGASFAFIALIDWFSRYLKDSSKQNLGIFTLVLALGFLTKFSLIMVLPIFALIWAWYTWTSHKPKSRAKAYGKGFGHMSLALLGVAVIISVIYASLMYSMPASIQKGTITESLSGGSLIQDTVKNGLISWADSPILRYVGHYLTGQAMVIQRVSGGNSTFLLGEYTNQSFAWYFPLTYVFKEPLAFIFLMLAVIGGFLLWISKDRPSRWISWGMKHIFLINVLTLLTWYWGISMAGNLNLGIRHILPVLPLAYILVSVGIVKILIPRGFSQVLLSVFVGWYMLTSLITYPYFISHMNLLIGDSAQGYQVFTDSNLDWGQDLPALAHWAKENNIETLYVDYFGGDRPERYLGEIFRDHSVTDPAPSSGYIAISATFYQGSFDPYRYPDRDDTNRGYHWLKDKEPVAVIGNSILVFNLD